MKNIKINKKIVTSSVILLITTAIILIIWFYIKNISYRNPIACIYQNGVLIEEIDLNAVTEPYELTIKDDVDNFNIIQIKKGEIGVIEASCSDGVCVRTGFIKNGTVPIICLPNRIEIKIIEKHTNEPDAVLR